MLKSLKMSNSKDIDLPTCQDCHFSTCQTILELNILPTLKRHPKCPIQPNCQEAIKKIVDIFQHAKNLSSMGSLLQVVHFQIFAKTHSSHCSKAPGLFQVLQNMQLLKTYTNVGKSTKQIIFCWLWFKHTRSKSTFEACDICPSQSCI